MDNKTKHSIIEELNELTTDMYVSETIDGYWTAYGMREGILSVLDKLGYEVITKCIDIHGDNVMMFLGIEEMTTK